MSAFGIILKFHSASVEFFSMISVNENHLENFWSYSMHLSNLSILLQPYQWLMLSMVTRLRDLGKILKLRLASVKLNKHISTNLVMKRFITCMLGPIVCPNGVQLPEQSLNFLFSCRNDTCIISVKYIVFMFKIVCDSFRICW